MKNISASALKKLETTENINGTLRVTDCADWKKYRGLAQILERLKGLDNEISAKNLYKLSRQYGFGIYWLNEQTYYLTTINDGTLTPIIEFTRF